MARKSAIVKTNVLSGKAPARWAVNSDGRSRGFIPWELAAALGWAPNQRVIVTYYRAKHARKAQLHFEAVHDTYKKRGAVIIRIHPPEPGSPFCYFEQQNRAFIFHKIDMKQAQTSAYVEGTKLVVLAPRGLSERHDDARRDDSAVSAAADRAERRAKSAKPEAPTGLSEEANDCVQAIIEGINDMDLRQRFEDYAAHRFRNADKGYFSHLWEKLMKEIY